MDIIVFIFLPIITMANNMNDTQNDTNQRNNNQWWTSWRENDTNKNTGNQDINERDVMGV